MIMMPMTMPAESRLNPGNSGNTFCSNGRQEQQREIPVDDRRNTAKQLKKRLGDFAHAERRKLRKVDGNDRSQRDGDQQSHQRTGDRPGKQNHDAVMRIVKQAASIAYQTKNRSAEHAGKTTRTR
jgi:hypothetical protein